jgi:hypothetical protein
VGRFCERSHCPDANTVLLDTNLHAARARRALSLAAEHGALGRAGDVFDAVASASQHGLTSWARNARTRSAMHVPIGQSLLVVVVLGAADLALFQRSRSATPTPAVPVSSVERAPTTPGLEPFEG